MLMYDEDGEGRCPRCMNWMPEGAEACVDCEDDDNSDEDG